MDAALGIPRPAIISCMPEPRSARTVGRIEAPSDWPDSRIDAAFKDVKADIAQIEADVRVYAPVVPVLSSNVDALLRDVDRLEAEVKVIVNRSVTRQLVIVSTPLFFGAITLIIVLVSLGKFG